MSQSLPLEGIRVLAIEQMQAMPYATQMLARFGADVVKVEHPNGGESGRSSLPAIEDADGRQTGATYLRNNLNKRSIAVDLKDPRGAELIRKLVPSYDVVAENFKAGTMERLGLGYEALREIHPGLVYVSVSGFGSLHPTPYGSWPAYSIIAEAMGGFYSFRPEPGRRPNIGVAGALADITSALFAVIGVLAALNARHRSGVGQKVDIAMMDAIVALMDMMVFNPSIGIHDNSVAAWPGISTAFEANDGLFVVQVGREHQWERFVRAIEREEWLEDPRFATREGWRDHLEDVIRPAVEAWARDKKKLEVSELLSSQGIVAGPSYDGDDLATDEHVRSRNMVVAVDRPGGGDPIRVVGNPVKLSGSDERAAERWPTLGRDTDAVLAEDLSLDEAEREALRTDGVIY